jgi:vacuolar iron transporter family protein
MKKNNIQSSIQTEVDASYLYEQIAASEENIHIKTIFSELSDIEKNHALSMLKSMQKKWISISIPNPSIRAKILNTIGKYFWYDYVIWTLVDIEKSIATEDKKTKLKMQNPLSWNEDNHVKILENLLKHKDVVSGEKLGKVEWKHKSIWGNALRAAVLWANDGLVSNMSLVMWVAWATTWGQWVLLAGLAGLLAWALSMALWEWISVKSSQELYERQMDLEMDEIEHNPEWETRELTLIYMAKWIEKQEAKKIAEEVMKDKEKAHEILVKEELWFTADELQGNAWEAAIASFFLFCVGAIIPVFPFFFWSGWKIIILSLWASTIWLFLIGSAITLFTWKSIWYSWLRQVIFWLAAAAITYSIWTILWVSIWG